MGGSDRSFSFWLDGVVSVIQLYTGVPGSGKSCHVSKDICGWLRRGQFVLANFDFDATPWEDHFIRIPDYPSCEEVLEIVRGLPRTMREHNFVIVVDEAQRVWNSRDWSDKARKPWLKFMTLSRHLSCDVVLIAQNSSMIDKQIRSCVQTEVRHMRVSAMGTIPFLLSGFGLLPLCYWVESYFGTRLRVMTGFFLPRKKWWERYDSYDLSFLEGVTAQVS